MTYRERGTFYTDQYVVYNEVLPAVQYEAISMPKDLYWQCPSALLSDLLYS